MMDGGHWLAPRRLMPAGQFASATSDAHVAKLGPLFQQDVSKSSAFNRKRETGNGKRKGGIGKRDKRHTSMSPPIRFPVPAVPFPRFPFPVSHRF
jgi:hypothetical protein